MGNNSDDNLDDNIWLNRNLVKASVGRSPATNPGNILSEYPAAGAQRATRAEAVES